jgi:hypothetical protein
MIRFPRKAVDVQAVAAYCVDNYLTFRTKGRYGIVGFFHEEEGGDWVTGEGWLAALIPLRNDILSGDMRSLYLGWLAYAANGNAGETTLEPPLPPGLGDLSEAHRALAAFLSIDDVLVEAAALRSTTLRPSVTMTHLRTWLRSLPASKKDSILLKLMQDEPPQKIQAKLLREFREQAGPRAQSRSDDRRTVAEILHEARRIAHRKKRESAERAKRQQEQRKRRKEQARRKRLDKLATRQAAAWRDVENHIASVQPKNYAEAVRLLQDLQALAVRQKKLKRFEKRLRDLRDRHDRKRTFIARLDQAGL